METLKRWQPRLQETRLFEWMPEEAFAVLNSCFDLHVYAFKAGVSFNTENRVGYLIEGKLERSDGIILEPFQILGAKKGKLKPMILTEKFETKERCLIAAANADILSSVCYFDCWFHGRLVKEIISLLEEQNSDIEMLP